MSKLPTVVLESFDPFHIGWSGAFTRPSSVFEAHRVSEVVPVLQQAERAALDGQWAVTMLSYEAAAAFEEATVVHPGGDFPMAWVALFDTDFECPSDTPSFHGLLEWIPEITFSRYQKDVETIREAIAHGDCYQVNYTFPLHARFDQEPWSLYRSLARGHASGYCAWLNLGRYIVMSLSPELLFQKEGRSLTVRPMKGTSRRGRWKEEDDLRKTWLATSEKNRAENLMIVDLLRNDLGRISDNGSVHVSRLFEIEQYETVFQMTSTIKSIAKTHVGLVQILEALFPSGSVTGAPKISAMSLIHQLESVPRNIYTGAIGLIRPGGDCTFNVAIRTLVLDTLRNAVTFNVGGGITFDSTAEGEYEECLTKMRFLSSPRPSFELLETLLLENGEYFLLDRHIERMKSSAEYFSYVWNEDSVRGEFLQVRINHSDRRWKVRILISREGGVRSEVELLAADSLKRWRVAVASERVDPSDPFFFHKTTHRVFYQKALQLTSQCDDLVFLNTRGEVTESTIGNVVVVRDGEKLTPPREAGLLAGTFRQELLEKGAIRECVLTEHDLRNSDEIYLVNSVRRWMRVDLVD